MASTRIAELEQEIVATPPEDRAAVAVSYPASRTTAVRLMLIEGARSAVFAYASSQIARDGWRLLAYVPRPERRTTVVQLIKRISI
jgi:hypothetical protein